VKEETIAYFDAAQRLMENAAKPHALGLYEDAGRNSYLAGMNVARGLLFEDGFQVTKRHKTLYGALAQVPHGRGIHDPTLTSFLPTMAKLKAIADYETGEAIITSERAAEAIKAANHFVEAIGKIAAMPAPGTGR
jgi:uncharacterized protein (UPF0332 family)